jgi:hypothetical protein
LGLGPGPIWPIGPGSQGPFGPLGPGPRAHWPNGPGSQGPLAHWAWVPGPIGPHPTGIQESYRYTRILHVYKNPTGIQESYRYTRILQVYKNPTGRFRPEFRFSYGGVRFDFACNLAGKSHFSTLADPAGKSSVGAWLGQRRAAEIPFGWRPGFHRRRYYGPHSIPWRLVRASKLHWTGQKHCKN